MSYHDNDGTKKSALPQALEDRFGIVSSACKQIKISRETFYRWCREDKEFKEKCDKARMAGEQKGGDAVEDALYNKILEGDTTAIIFYCKTKLRNRGYQEKIVTQGTFSLTSLSDEELDMIESSIGREVDLSDDI